jgi:hypothetical protein
VLAGAAHHPFMFLFLRGVTTMPYLVNSKLKSCLVWCFMSLALASPASFAQTTMTDAEIADSRAAAQKLLADGMPNEALKRIEQVIIASPTDLSARFFRAQILVNLGRGGEIREEVELMTKLGLSSADRAKADALLAKIDGGPERFKGRVTLKLAMGYADNVNAWPKKGSTTISGIELALPDPVNQKFDPVSDRITEGTGIFSGTYALNERRDLKAKIGFTGKLKDGADTVNADQKYYVGNLGVQKHFVSGAIVEAGISRAYLNRVNRHKNMDVNTDVGIMKYSVEASTKLARDMRLGYRYDYSTNDNKNRSSADLSDSKTHSNKIYLGAPVHERLYLRGSLSTARTRSNQESTVARSIEEGKKRVNKNSRSASLLAFVMLPYDQRIIGTATYRLAKYKQQFVNVGKNRRDKTFIYSLGYSIDGGQFLPELAQLRFGFDVTQSRTSSNQSSAEINSKSYMLSASRSFDL